jgi:predicted secreted protein
MENPMKRKNAILAIVPLIALSLVLGACATPNADAATKPPTTTDNTGNNSYMPPLDNPTKTIKIELLYDDLLVQKHITQDVVIENGGSLIVILGSNPSTGYSWQKAVIGNSAILPEYSRQYVEGISGLVGAPGKDTWTFKTNQAGSSTITFNYNRPGEQPEWTVTLNVTIK